MGQPRWKPVKDDVLAAMAAATGVSDMAGRLGVSFSTLTRYCADEGIDLGPIKNIAAGKGRPHATKVTLPPEEENEHDRELIRVKDELAKLKRKYDVSCKTENLYADVLEQARAVMSTPYRAKLATPHVGRGNTAEDAILAWADWHAGEVVDYDVMQGFNAYDPAIMCRRAQYTVDHTLSVLFDCHAGTTFEHLWVFGLGDDVTGDLLDEAKATNAMGVFESMRLVAHIRARALTELSAHIPVTYVGVPGNHPRRAPKMQWKLPTENGDWLIAQMIGDLTAGNPRVSVVAPKAWTAGVTVRGWNHSLNHGYSAARGGYGGIPWYSFQRTDGKLTALNSAHGKRVHFRWYGHVHQRAELPAMDGEGEQFIVGSLMGGNEYALEALSAYADPVQRLVGCHEKHGVTWRYPLNVKHADETPSRYEDLLP